MMIKEVLDNIPHAGFFGDASDRISGFTTDSRKARRNDLFIALDGQRSRGVDFTADVIRRKCSAICADRKYSQVLEQYSAKINIILVNDAFKALRDIAAFRRSLFKGHVVAVTGSNGKTTTKEIIAGLLASKYRVLKNEKNFNNEVGVPLTVFGLKPNHQMLVVECGVNHPGEMGRLADIVRPEFAVITNIGSAHLEFFGSEENVAREKSKICDRTSGTVLIGLDNRYIDFFRRPGLHIVTVHPEDKMADYHFDSFESLGLEGWSVQFKGMRMRFPLYGTYNLENLIMAVACASEMGVSAGLIRSALEKTGGVPGRAFVLSNSSITLIDESYNSNFSALSASLDNLRGLRDFDAKFVVIGSMKELGTMSGELHGRIGVQLSNMDLAGIFLVGHETEEITRNYSGVIQIRQFESIDIRMELQLFNALQTTQGRKVVLIKGSRANRLDLLVAKVAVQFGLRARKLRGRKN